MHAETPILASGKWHFPHISLRIKSLKWKFPFSRVYSNKWTIAVQSAKITCPVAVLRLRSPTLAPLPPSLNAQFTPVGVQTVSFRAGLPHFSPTRGKATGYCSARPTLLYIVYRQALLSASQKIYGSCMHFLEDVIFPFFRLYFEQKSEQESWVAHLNAFAHQIGIQ